MRIEDTIKLTPKMAFRLNCISELYKNLGCYDAIVEFTEISIRDFIHQAHHANNFDSFLQTKSLQHNIRVNTIDQTVFRARISQSYILSVYQTAELFLHQFREEYNELFDSNIILDDTKDNILIKTIRKVSAINPATNHIGAHRLAIFNYYRVVRNKYSHERISENRVEREFRIVSNFTNQIHADYQELTAPNEFVNISFDDFILFSRVVKDIACRLNDLIIPTNNQIKGFYERKNLFNEFNENLERKKNALQGHMRSTFGIEQQQSDEIIDILFIPLA